ncbi:MAG: hypothetical protein BroJett015_31870 [Chloroflexota bacterium]|nr:hypothetical protein [Chloroflexota bacterium]GIK57524.1 MAG: hypothetical protein BroJett015_31870 [Chloroflexota bacterium]
MGGEQGDCMDLTSLLPKAVAAIPVQKLVKSPEELNGYLWQINLRQQKVKLTFVGWGPVGEGRLGPL